MPPTSLQNSRSFLQNLLSCFLIAPAPPIFQLASEHLHILICYLVPSRYRGAYCGLRGLKIIVGGGSSKHAKNQEQGDFLCGFKYILDII